MRCDNTVPAQHPTGRQADTVNDLLVKKRPAAKEADCWCWSRPKQNSVFIRTETLLMNANVASGPLTLVARNYFLIA